jgi:hypothetical protein
MPQEGGLRLNCAISIGATGVFVGYVLSYLDCKRLKASEQKGLNLE